MIAAILDVFVGAIYGPKNKDEKDGGFIGFSCKLNIFILYKYV